MKLSLNSFLLFFLSTLAPLPIFFDLSNLSIIFYENILLGEPPLIPLPISFIFFGIVFIINLPFSLIKFTNKRFSYILCLILLLIFLSIINQIPITRFIQFTLPISLLLSIPGIVNSFNIYAAYSFIISLSSFSILHLLYNFFYINNVSCTYNCNTIFLGYEIYHGDVGFPDVVNFVVSGSLLLSQNLKNSVIKSIFFYLSIFLLFYSFFIGRSATLLAVIISILIVSAKQILKLLLSLKINRTFFLSSFLILLLFIIFGEMIFERIELLFNKISNPDGIESPRMIIYEYYLRSFLENPNALIFGGLSKEIDGHNFIISILANIGLIGLSIIVSCYVIVFSQLKERFKLSLKNLNFIEFFALILSFATVLVGNFVNDALTQPFNVIVMFVFLILLISILENKNNLVKTFSKI